MSLFPDVFCLVEGRQTAIEGLAFLIYAVAEGLAGCRVFAASALVPAFFFVIAGNYFEEIERTEDKDKQGCDNAAKEKDAKTFAEGFL